MSDPGGAATESHGSGALQGYRELLALPGARGAVTVSLLAKYTAAMLLTSAISGPLRGRLVDRGRRGPVLGCCLAGCLAGMTGLVPAALAHMPVVVFLGAATVAGLCFPPVGALFLAYWNAAAPTAASRVSANSLESALIDFTLTGPLVATLLSTAFSPVCVFVLSGIEMAVVVVLLGSRGRAIAGSAAVRDADGRWQRIPAGPPASSERWVLELLRPRSAGVSLRRGRSRHSLSERPWSQRPCPGLPLLLSSSARSPAP
ncbi:MFS transporter [Streptomyces mirabilis]|uniref:hypothetical protein n=1 Tax=Streptomyces mirabilis TaxID=68239 RepID=UPI0036D204F8